MKELKRQKTIEEVVGYEAFDGKVFKTEEECEKYEESSYSAITKDFEQLIVGKRFEECRIWEDFGYGSDEYEMAVIDIRDENDLYIANRYYQQFAPDNVDMTIDKNYIGNRVLVNLGSEYDRFVNPCPRTKNELRKQFEATIEKYFSPESEEENNV